ncbi:MAG TPA: arginase [Chlamydiales bacterium]|nr:arginase [Chlamydiales bacterium]
MIPAIGIASGLGGRTSHAGAGPLFLQKELKIDLSWHTLIQPKIDKTQDLYETIAALNQKLAQAAFHMTLKEPFFLAFGGDHSSAIGTWSGVSFAKKEEGDIGLLWIDAHMDSHTPQTSESGYIHGMPLAALLGYGDPRLTQILHPAAKLKPRNVALIGIRSFESGEAELLKNLGIRVYFMEEVKKRGLDVVVQEAHALISQETIGYGVSFDLDSIDPQWIPAVGTPVPNGIDPEEMIAAFSFFEHAAPLAFELVEYNPFLDGDWRTLEFIRKVIKTIERTVFACSV